MVLSKSRLGDDNRPDLPSAYLDRRMLGLGMRRTRINARVLGSLRHTSFLAQKSALTRVQVPSTVASGFALKWREDLFLQRRCFASSGDERKKTTKVDQAVDLINDRFERFPRETLVAMLCMEVVSIYSIHELMVAGGIAVPGEFALAFAMGRPLRRLRLPLELLGAAALGRAFPALKRVKITSAVSGAMPASLRERFNQNKMLNQTGSRFGQVMDKYGAAYFISARWLGLGVVLIFYSAISYGFDVSAVFATYGISEFGTVLGTWAAAVSTSAFLYPFTIVSGAMISPGFAKISRHITRSLEKKG